MLTQQEQQIHVQSSYEHQVNHPHTTFKCYLRTPDMRCKIQSICTDQSVSELKQSVKKILLLDSVSQSSLIKLIVNQTELSDDMNLALHLFQNAIIHVLVPQQKNSENFDTTEININIKEPPMSSPAYTLQNVPHNLSIQQLKTQIIAFYRQSNQANPICNLNVTDLYLVYGGRILTDDKLVGDYDINQNGILYVVNGNVYARQVTREQAQRRIEQVKRGQYNEAPPAEIVSQANEFPLQSSDINEHQDVVFNIIQNIVHDEDSEVEGETANDMSRSQKIIHRYNSVNQILPQNKDLEDCVVTEKQVEQKPNIDEIDEQEFKQQISENLCNLVQKIAQRPEVHEQEKPTQEGLPQQMLQSEVMGSIARVVNSFDEETPGAKTQERWPQNDIEGVSQSIQDHPDSVPQNNEDEEMLL